MDTESTKKPYRSPAEPEVIISVATAASSPSGYESELDGSTFYSSTPGPG